MMWDYAALLMLSPAILYGLALAVGAQARNPGRCSSCAGATWSS
jgi:hypothetical protein